MKNSTLKKEYNVSLIEEVKDNSHAILKILLYFEVFNYPLTYEEICRFSDCSKQDTKTILANLILENKIFQLDNFYSVTNDVNKAIRRKKGNEFAKSILQKANDKAKFISKFPFIEAVYVSGSLSKGYFEKTDDIDYFIITKPNRLWFAKTLLIAFKKIFLLNSKKYFCINYFISSNALELTEKNLFTAVEFVTLLPLLDKNSLFEKFKNQNKWVANYFPEYEINQTSNPIKKYKFKQFLEFLFNGFVGNQLERLSKNVTKTFQQRKYRKLKKADFNIAFKGNDSVSKHHPDNNQKKVITLLNQKIEEFNKVFKTNISKEIDKSAIVNQQS